MMFQLWSAIIRILLESKKNTNRYNFTKKTIGCFCDLSDDEGGETSRTIFSIIRVRQVLDKKLNAFSMKILFDYF